MEPEWKNFAEHLDRCNVFYMCGGDRHVFADMLRNNVFAMAKLESVIRSGKILYIGACGGACILASSYAKTKGLGVIPGMITISDN